VSVPSPFTRAIGWGVNVLFCVQKTDSMQQSPPWQSRPSGASKEILRILWIPDVHYRDQNSTLFAHVLSQISPLHTFQPDFLYFFYWFTVHIFFFAFWAVRLNVRPWTCPRRAHRPFSPPFPLHPGYHPGHWPLDVKVKGVGVAPSFGYECNLDVSQSSLFRLPLWGSHLKHRPGAGDS